MDLRHFFEFSLSGKLFPAPTTLKMPVHAQETRSKNQVCEAQAANPLLALARGFGCHLDSKRLGE